MCCPFVVAPSSTGVSFCKKTSKNKKKIEKKVKEIQIDFCQVHARISKLPGTVVIIHQHDKDLLFLTKKMNLTLWLNLIRTFL